MVLALALSVYLLASDIKYALLPILSLTALVGASLRRRIGYELDRRIPAWPSH
jgi:hypothetical protein